MTVLKIILPGFALCVLLLNARQFDFSKELHVSSTPDYYREVKANPNKKLVEIKKYIPGIVLDIRYATTNNFTRHVMYKQARAFARLPVVLALQQVENDLRKQGLGLKIYDGYRPYAVTVKFYELIRDTDYVADPRTGSRHNRGCAIDLSLIDLKTGKELNMPTGFDSFSKKAGANYQNLPAAEIHNRLLLRTAMEKYGFRVMPTEWWHFDFKGWKNYEVLNVPFSNL
jgi:zinc D-Ala-D-Ala dipeptidase